MAKVLGFTINIEGTEAAIESATDLKLAIQAINKQLKDPALTKPQTAKLEKQLIDLKARQKEVNAEVRASVKARQAEFEVAEDNVGAYRKLSNQLIVARTRMKDLAAAGKENTEEFKALEKTVGAFDSRLKDIDARAGQFQRNVGDYENAFKNAIPFLGDFSEGIKSIGEQASLSGKAIATSFFVFELINQLAAGVQALSEFTEEFRVLQGEIQNFTGETGKALEQSTAQVSAIANTYQEDAKQIADAANTLSKEFGITLGRALELTEAGFRKGADAQGDFLQQLREYPAQFREAGNTAEEFVGILIKAQTEGIYSDTGLDAVKEFGLRIREQTKATRDALNNAFGEEFTSNLFGSINDGSITTTEALSRVTKGLRDTELTAEQTQRVIADTFGGPGENAGIRYLELLADIDSETQNVTESTNEYQSQQEELFEANLALAEAQARLAGEFGNSGVEFAKLTANVKAFLFGIGADILQFFDELPATVSGVSAAIFQFRQNLSAGFGLFGETGSVADAYKKAYLEGLEKVEKDNEIAKQAEEVGAKIARSTSKGVSDQEKKDGDKRRRDSEREAKRAADKQAKERQRALENERRDTLQQLGVIEKLRINTIKTALGATDELIKGTIEKTEDGFRILSGNIESTAQDIFKRVKQISDKPDALFDPVKIGEQVQTGLDTIAPLLSAFQQRSAAKATEAIDAQISEQEESIAELEEQISNSSGRQREALEQRLAAENEALARSNSEREKLAEEQAKKEKGLSIIQSIIQTALSVSRALANPPGVPFSIPQAIIAGIQGAAQTAIIAAQPLATGGIITGRRISDRQNIPTQSNGDNVLATVRRGEVVLNRIQQAALGGASTFRAIGVPGFAGGGAITAPISAPTLPQAVGGGNAELTTVIKQLQNGIEATNNRIDRIKTFVVSEDVANDLGEGEAIRTQATFE